MIMKSLKGVFFDQDGVIVDTEKDGHRVAFNLTFEEMGFPFQWTVKEYGELLKIGGGKERFRHYIRTVYAPEMGDRELDELVGEVHKRKTDRFVRLIEEGHLPLRPGVERLMREINERGLVLGICTTSNERSARAIVSSLLSAVQVDLLLAGDVVPHKKPDPAIYRLACERTGLLPENCLAIEDSENGKRAALKAGLPVILTVNDYTLDENHEGASLVVTCLGDPGAKQARRIGGKGQGFEQGVVTLDIILKTLQGGEQYGKN